MTAQSGEIFCFRGNDFGGFTMYSILFSSDIKFQTACPSQDNAKISDETFLPQKLVVSALDSFLSRQLVFVGSLEKTRSL